MPFEGRGQERRVPVLCLKINVTASFNQLLRDGRMPMKGLDVERRGPTVVLKIDVSTFFEEQYRDGGIPSCNRLVKRGGVIRVLVVDEGLLACRRQQCPNSHCITITRSSRELRPLQNCVLRI